MDTFTFIDTNRNFNIGDNNYSICSIFCNFDYMKLNKSQLIKGIYVEAKNNSLRIDPKINTIDSKKEKRYTDIFLKYTFKNTNNNTKYKLVDIYINSPPNIVIFGKRFDMECCHVFHSEKEDKYIIMCVPIQYVSDSKIDKSTELYKFISIIENNFPKKDKLKLINYDSKIKNEWEPLMFLPSENKQEFFTWEDKNPINSFEPKIKYIQFINPISISNKFYDTFMLELKDNIKNNNIKMNEEPSTIDIYYNLNKDVKESFNNYSIKYSIKYYIKYIVRISLIVLLIICYKYYM